MPSRTEADIDHETLLNRGIFMIQSITFKDGSAIYPAPVSPLTGSSNDAKTKIIQNLSDSTTNGDGSDRLYDPDTGRLTLPHHVDALRQILLNFGSPERSSSVLDIEKAPQKIDTVDTSAVSIPRQDAIANVARNLHRNGVCEDLWVTFYTKYIFPINQDWLTPDSLPVTHSRLDSYAMSQNTQWSIRRRNKHFVHDNLQLTRPRPDLFYGFQVSQEDDSEPEGFDRLRVLSNFTLRRLALLYARNNIISTPTSELRNWAEKQKNLASVSLKQTTSDNGSRPLKHWHHAICFPYTVVELKIGQASDKDCSKCIRQAANASSAALSILEGIFMDPDADSGSQSEVPPVIAFTCVGGNVQLWLMFSIPVTKKENIHLMVCIWKGSMTDGSAVSQIGTIISQMFIWAARVLKPMISYRIDLWSDSTSKLDLDDSDTICRACRSSPEKSQDGRDPAYHSDVLEAGSDEYDRSINQSPFVQKSNLRPPMGRRQSSTNFEDLEYLMRHMNLEPEYQTPKKLKTPDKPTSRSKSTPMISLKDEEAPLSAPAQKLVESKPLFTPQKARSTSASKVDARGLNGLRETKSTGSVPQSEQSLQQKKDVIRNHRSSRTPEPIHERDEDIDYPDEPSPSHHASRKFKKEDSEDDGSMKFAPPKPRQGRRQREVKIEQEESE